MFYPAPCPVFGNKQLYFADSEAYLTLPLSDGQDSGFSGSHENIANNGGRRRVVSTSLSTHPPSKWGTIQDFHEHKLIPDHDPLDLSYRLYAAVVSSFYFCLSFYFFILSLFFFLSISSECLSAVSKQVSTLLFRHG